MSHGKEVDAIARLAAPQTEAGTGVEERTRGVHPEEVALYGGISGVELPVDEFDLCEGLVLRRTYAHVMAPYILAFAKPLRKGTHHPAPWKAARGGLGFDVSIEIQLAEGARPTTFSRLNTLWWVLALLRLRSGALIRLPVISDMAFSEVATAASEPNLWTVEMSPKSLFIDKDLPGAIQEDDLVWLRSHFRPAAELMENEEFNRAFQTFDSTIWAHSVGSAIVMLWAALECVVRPGRTDVTKRLSATIATFLASTRQDRDRVFQRVRSLYEARGGSAHDAREPAADEFLETFRFARNVFIHCIEQKALPDTAALLSEWKATAGSKG